MIINVGSKTIRANYLTDIADGDWAQLGERTKERLEKVLPWAPDRTAIEELREHAAKQHASRA